MFNGRVYQNVQLLGSLRSRRGRGCAPLSVVLKAKQLTLYVDDRSAYVIWTPQGIVCESRALRKSP
jgi:hypothetical protein